MNRRLQGTLILMITAIVWGISFVSQSVSMELIEPNTFCGIRTLIGALSLVPVILVMDNSKKKKGVETNYSRKTLIQGGIICGIILCASATVQTYGLKYTTAGKAGFLTAMYMVLVPIYSLFLGKKIRPATALSVLIAVIGMYFLCIKEGFKLEIGDLLVLVCAFIFAFHILAVDYFSPRVDGVKLSFLQFLVCGTINIILMFLFEKPVMSEILKCTVPILYSGIMSCGVAYTLQIIGQKYAEPTVSSIVMSLEAVFAALAGWILIGQAMTLREIFGCILMFTAIIIVQLPEKKKAQS
ncbi:MAG: DMT family transporter [Clostridia bacterium]|nr:DMT family transporter [Clostridia bacterium]